MKHIQTFESFLNEAANTKNPTWFPIQIRVLKDIYLNKRGSYTSTGPNMSDWVINKGQIMTLSHDGSSSPSSDASYEVAVDFLPAGDRKKAISEETVLDFYLKDIAELLNQKAVEILDEEMFGHNFALGRMSGIKFKGT